MIARHRGQYGNWCPGYRRDAHPARDLTVDHVVPLAAGGPSLDIANCAVLCRSCNSTKGASAPDRGYPHAASALVEDRALPLCVRGRVSRIIPASQYRNFLRQALSNFAVALSAEHRSVFNFAPDDPASYASAGRRKPGPSPSSG
ncbi:MAG: HNH endonuclease signature motif containing protein [Aeromicrobium sp.]